MMSAIGWSLVSIKIIFSYRLRMLVAEFMSLNMAVFGWTDLGGIGGGSVDSEVA